MLAIAKTKTQKQMPALLERAERQALTEKAARIAAKFLRMAFFLLVASQRQRGNSPATYHYVAFVGGDNLPVEESDPDYYTFYHIATYNRKGNTLREEEVTIADEIDSPIYVTFSIENPTRWVGRGNGQPFRIHLFHHINAGSEQQGNNLFHSERGDGFIRGVFEADNGNVQYRDYGTLAFSKQKDNPHASRELFAWDQPLPRKGAITLKREKFSNIHQPIYRSPHPNHRLYPPIVDADGDNHIQIFTPLVSNDGSEKITMWATLAKGRQILTIEDESTHKWAERAFMTKIRKVQGRITQLERQLKGVGSPEEQPTTPGDETKQQQEPTPPLRVTTFSCHPTAGQCEDAHAIFPIEGREPYAHIHIEDLPPSTARAYLYFLENRGNHQHPLYILYDRGKAGCTVKGYTHIQWCYTDAHAQAYFHHYFEGNPQVTKMGNCKTGWFCFRNTLKIERPCNMKASSILRAPAAITLVAATDHHHTASIELAKGDGSTLSPLPVWEKVGDDQEETLYVPCLCTRGRRKGGTPTLRWMKKGYGTQLEEVTDPVRLQALDKIATRCSVQNMPTHTPSGATIAPIPPAMGTPTSIRRRDKREITALLTAMNGPTPCTADDDQAFQRVLKSAIKAGRYDGYGNDAERTGELMEVKATLRRRIQALQSQYQSTTAAGDEAQRTLHTTLCYYREALDHISWWEPGDGFLCIAVTLLMTIVILVLIRLQERRHLRRRRPVTRRRAALP